MHETNTRTRAADEAYIEKPRGKPILVPKIDKHTAMNTNKNNIMEENDNE